ncbi:hypothetical protein BIV25_07735 [Streptomyces sp. MUSC 14]|nr:hypothetical protein BIV25_07735 [Streptomyces sp. MUSC 14]
MLDGAPGAGGPFDAPGPRPTEGDVQAEVLGEGGLDGLLLHLTAAGHGGLLAQFVVADADERRSTRRIPGAAVM